MKKLLILTVLVFIGCSIAAAQRELKPRQDFDRTIDDRTIKNRSMELERIKRDAQKAEPRAAEKMPEEKFQEIKGDFEKIQKLQSEIVTFYTTGRQIEFGKIAKSSAEMNKSALHLQTNLFVEEASAKEKNKSKSAEAKSKDIKNLIVELDGAIGKFVANPIFQNIKIVNPKDSQNAQKDLSDIIKISEELARESEKMKNQN